MPIVRVFAHSDGTVAVMQMIDDALLTRDTQIHLARYPGSTWEDYSNQADALAKMPQSRYFRNAWTLNPAGGVMVDLAKARGQRLAEIRMERDRRLAESDGRMLRAQEQGGDTTALQVERQALRDLPIAVELDLSALETAEGLEHYQPSWPRGVLK